MTKINYVIASFNSRGNRRHTHPLPQHVLTTQLDTLVELDNTACTVTLVRASAPVPAFDDYYAGSADIRL